MIPYDEESSEDEEIYVDDISDVESEDRFNDQVNSSTRNPEYDHFQGWVCEPKKIFVYIY